MSEVRWSGEERELCKPGGQTGLYLVTLLGGRFLIFLGFLPPLLTLGL